MGARLRALTAVLLVAVAVAVPVSGATKKKACLQACAGAIGACTARNADVGGLANGCRKAILERCKQDGPTACASLITPTCGNGEAERGEACDGADLRSRGCIGEGFLGGTLACDTSCGLDTSGCIATPPASSTLLLPFVTNQAGLDTGIAISNTTADPFGTTVQEGTCTLRFFPAAGGTAPAPSTTPKIAAGRQFIALASSVVPGFKGYVVADCTFPLARGFAFISDLGARNFAFSGNLEVVPTGGESLGGPPPDATNLLIPFASNQSGFDTTVSITNTGSGGAAACTFHYFSGSGNNPATQTSNPLAAGEQMSFTLSGGGDHGIDPRPAFQGYIIAECAFPGARAQAVMGDVGLRNLATNIPVELIPAGPRR